MTKHSTQPKIEKLRHLPILKQKINSISMDFMTGIPKVAGNNAILISVCRLNNWSVFVSCSKQSTAEKVIQLFLDNCLKHKEYPWDIVSDREWLFQTQFWQHIILRIGVRLSMTTVWHPQGNGQTGVIDYIFNMYMMVFCERDQQEWPMLIPRAELCYNRWCLVQRNNTNPLVLWARGRVGKRLIR